MSAAFADGLLLGGRRARWVWLTAKGRISHARADRIANLPCGVAIDHGGHSLLVAWVPLADGHQPFTVDSLLPLSVAELVTCAHCGIEGRIVEGTWLPVEVSS